MFTAEIFVMFTAEIFVMFTAGIFDSGPSWAFSVILISLSILFLSVRSMDTRHEYCSHGWLPCPS